MIAIICFYWVKYDYRHLYRQKVTERLHKNGIVTKRLQKTFLGFYRKKEYGYIFVQNDIYFKCSQKFSVRFIREKCF